MFLLSIKCMKKFAFKKTKSGIGKEIQTVGALLKQVKESMVIAYKFKGKRFDCGFYRGFVELL